MTDQDSTDDMFALWRKQLEASTEAWSKAVERMASHDTGPGTPPDPTQIWQQFMDPGAAAWARFPSAGPVDPDVFGQWKHFLDDWLAAWSTALEQAMGTEAFAETLGKTLDQVLTAQSKVKEAAERSTKSTLDALGLPSRDQIIGLSRQLMDLGDRLEALEDKLETPGGPSAPARGARPAKARKTRKTASTKSRPRAKTSSGGATRKKRKTGKA